MNVLPRSIKHYLADPRLSTFLPDHLREAASKGIVIHRAVWDNEGGAYVDVSGIDTDNASHVEVGTKAGHPKGNDGGYRRETVDSIPDGLKLTVEY
jgi:hypothetical protein